jgi:ubiquinone/menaquinone biosynthesis C-methylase UbiE
MKQGIAFWDKIASRYDKMTLNKYRQAYQDTIQLSKKYIDNNAVVLDFACGTGITAIDIAPFVNKIYCLDISDKMLDLARKKAELNRVDNIEFLNCDLFAGFLNKQKFDTILAFNVLHFLNNMDAAISRINELLTPNGIFISVTDCFGEKASYINMLKLFLGKIGIVPMIQKLKTDELTTIIKEKGFAILESKTLYPDPPNYFIVSKKQ